MPVRLSLSLISGPDAVRLETRAVDGYEFVLGRGHDVDWSLLDPEKNILSRRHCMLSLEDDDWWVIDLSGNGTFLNHEPRAIGEGGKRRLRDGDRMRVGAYEFQVQLADSTPVRDAPIRDVPIRPAYRPDPGAEAWPPAPAGGASPGANPFGDEDDEPPLAPRPVPPAPSRTAAPNARAGNPFADSSDDGAWPPPLPVSAYPASGHPVSAPFGSASSDDAPIMRPASAAFNPFQDAPETPSAPVVAQRARPRRRGGPASARRVTIRSAAVRSAATTTGRARGGPYAAPTYPVPARAISG